MLLKTGDQFKELKKKKNRKKSPNLGALSPEVWLKATCLYLNNKAVKLIKHFRVMEIIFYSIVFLMVIIKMIYFCVHGALFTPGAIPSTAQQPFPLQSIKQGAIFWTNHRVNSGYVTGIQLL